MLLIRALLIWAVICLHVIGGAALFRRYFPRESPWWGFFLPALALVILLNFIEYIVAVPQLVWLLPFSSGGLIWMMARPGLSWRGMAFPTTLFLISFSYAFFIRCLEPDVNFYCTEGLTDLNRILDFCLGDKLPATDCWLPPYPHVGYYTFMQYGASVLERLLSVDIGTAYNVSFALLNGLTLLATAAAAHTLSRFRKWVAIVTLIVMAGAAAGSTPLLTLLHLDKISPTDSIDIGGGEDSAHQEFASLLQDNPPEIGFRLYTPGCYLYYSEFHSTQGGHFLALLTVFGVAEVLRRKRAIMPWIYVAVAPILAILTCPWFIMAIAPMGLPALLLAWLARRRPPRWRDVFVGVAVVSALLWPSLNALIHGAAPEPFFWAYDLTHDYGTIFVQWWPIYMPWVVLCFAWKRMNLGMRWLHFVLLPMFYGVEVIFFNDRGTTLEKTWGAVFGVGVAILYPILFSQKGLFYRTASGLLILSGLISLYAWFGSTYEAAFRDHPLSILHLEGDSFIENYSQLHRMKEVLSKVRGQTVLAGKSREAFFMSPSLPAFTDNRCFLGWTNAEETAGHPDEAHARAKQTNDFYAGNETRPVAFLDANNITVVLIWPEDRITDEQLAKFKNQLIPEFSYFDCKGEDIPGFAPMEDRQNAGVFIKRALLDKTGGY